MITLYSELKKQLIAGFDELLSLIREKGVLDIENQVVDECKKIDSNLFNLVVLGQFKRGKTTLINALIGEDLLPTAVVPLTSIITMLKYGEQRSARVCFLDGSLQDIPFSDLSHYVAERGNPNNILKVKYVEIFLPSPFLSDGVVLVDTPGIGSTYRHNTEVAYDFLPQADAALFVLSVDPPLSEVEGRYLVDIHSSVSKTFYVLNKIDYLNDDERKESLVFCKDTIETFLGKDGVSLFPLEAKSALRAKLQNDTVMLSQSGLQELEKSLFAFFAEKKGMVAILSSARRGLEFSQEMKGYIDLEKKAFELPSQELEQKIIIFEEQLKRVHRERKDALYILEGEIESLIRTIGDDLALLQKELKPKMDEKIEHFLQEYSSLSIPQLSREIKTYISETLTAEFEKWKTLEEEKISKQFESILERFVVKMNSIMQLIHDISAGVFNIQLSGHLEVEALTKESNFYYKFGKDGAALVPNSLSVSALLPRTLARKKILQQAFQDTEAEIERNCGRIRSDFAERSKKSFLEFRYHFEEQVDEMIQVIREILFNALNLKQQNDKDCEKALDHLYDEEQRSVSCIEKFQIIVESVNKLL